MSLQSLTSVRTATIQRPAVTAGTSGGQVRTFAAVYTDIPCTIQPSPGTIATLHGQEQMAISHVLYTTTAISLKPGDRVVSGGVNYRVISFANAADKSRLYAAYLEQLQ